MDRAGVVPEALGRDRVRQVRDERVRPGPDLVGHLPDRVSAHVVDQDGTSGPGKGAGRRRADAAAGARDEDDAAVEVDHVLPPFCGLLKSEAGRSRLSAPGAWHPMRRPVPDKGPPGTSIGRSRPVACAS